VPAAATPPPKHLSAPDAGLVALTPAAVPSNSPQLLNPGVALGLAEASHLAAALSAQLAAAGGSGGTAVTGSAEGSRKAVQQGLQQFDAQHGPDVGGCGLVYVSSPVKGISAAQSCLHVLPKP
jgi:hypothetical protein